MEEELEDRDSVLAEHALEVVDLLIPLRPHGAGNEIAHANHEHILVMRAVEDADGALRRSRVMDAPEIVVAQLEVTRLLEAGNDASLGIRGIDDSANATGASAAVASLQDGGQRALGLRVQELLELGNWDEERYGLFLEGIFAWHPFGPPRVAVANANRRVARDGTEL